MWFRGRASLGSGGTVAWDEWVYPFERTQGLTYAHPDFAAKAVYVVTTTVYCPLKPSRETHLQTPKQVLVLFSFASLHPLSARKERVCVCVW